VLQFLHLRDRCALPTILPAAALILLSVSLLAQDTKEMPDLDALYNKFTDQGFVVLAISDEEAARVSPFIDERRISYPVLLDPQRKANAAFIVEGIPKSILYDRGSQMVAQSMDMRTRNPFLEMLAEAGVS
jgi:hypothetical protein